MKEIQTPAGKILCVKVPIGSYNHYIDKSGNINYQWDNHVKEGSYMLLGGYSKWQILNTASKLTEEQAKEIVEYGIGYYRDYSAKEFNLMCFDTALESFKSLMTAEGIYTENPYGDKPGYIEENGQFDANEIEYLNQEARIKWQQAEENTGEWLILIKNK